MKNKSHQQLLSVALTLILLAGCSPSIEEAQKLGFESVKQMTEVQSMGYKNLSEFNESRAKKAGFTDYATMKEANSKGYLSMEDYNKAEELKKAKENIINESMNQVKDTCASGNGQAKNILGSNDLSGVHSFCFGFNSALGDLVNKTRDFESDLEKMSFKLGACDSINQSEAQRYMKLGAGKASSCAILNGIDQSACFNNTMSACSPVMQEAIKASQLMSAASMKYEKDAK